MTVQELQKICSERDRLSTGDTSPSLDANTNCLVTPSSSTSDLTKALEPQHTLGGVSKVPINYTDGFHVRGFEENETSIMPEKAAPPPIAVVGMALRLPGGVTSPEGLWDLLINKKDGQSRIPDDRYNIDAFHGPYAKAGEVGPQQGYFLQDSLKHIDAGFFAMSNAELEELDPQQKLLLEVVWECMEGAGQTNWKGNNVGCFVGVFGEDWLDLCSKDTQSFGMYRVTGTGNFGISNRISYEYDLKGPSMTIQTGCSSSLIGLHEACQALYNDQCTSAIVAGTNIIITPTMTQAMSMQGVLSPTGSCKTFDAAADGYARGEAINAIYIKKLDDALRDGDPIRAVIRATASNCDGKPPSIGQPNSKAHEDMIRMAYNNAQLPLNRTAYVECHGTGTPVGDPLEIAAVGRVFHGSGIYIGSVKPNVGHSEGASGITSLIKTVLALEHRTIPPQINYSTPNPKIPFKEANLMVPVEPTPWPTRFHERASINSFGIGGANAHVIIDSATSYLGKPLPRETISEERRSPYLIPLSANISKSLHKRSTDLQHYLGSNSHRLSDVAYTFADRREHMVYRTFGIASEDRQIEFSSSNKVPRVTPSVNFVFTGQGAQWVGMGAELIRVFPSFCQDMDALDEVLHQLVDGPSWSLKDELITQGDSSRINSAEFSQPLCTAIQVGLVNLLCQWGICPSAVVGHSSGEIAAAYSAGAITAEAAIIIAFYRGQATKKLTRTGGMAVVGLGRKAVAPFLEDGVVIACENSPKSITLSGDVNPLEKTLGKILDEQPDTFCRHLHVDIAYHSHHMVEVGDHYERLITPHLHPMSPTVPFHSSVTGEIGIDNFTAAYWRSNMEKPVLFYTAISSILTDKTGSDVFLEIGPHSALSGPLRQIFKEISTKAEPIYIPTLVRNENQVDCLLKAAGHLFQQGIEVKFGAINGPGELLTDIPPYPWQHNVPYWKESRICRSWRLRQFPHHELLGSRILESSELEPLWRNVLHLDNVPWLRDHKVIEDTVFPAAGYIAAVGEAIRQTSGLKNYTIRGLLIKNALILQESQELVTSMKPARLTDSLDSEWHDFAITSYDGSTWIKHCTGQVRANLDPQPDVDSKSYLRPVQSNSWYAAMRKLGLNYGPRFQGLQGIHAHPIHAIARGNVWDDKAQHESFYSVHPTTIDQSLQLLTVAVSNGLARRLVKLAVPAAIGEISIAEAGSNFEMEVEARITPKGAISGLAVVTSGGKTVISMKEGVFAPLESNESDSQQVDSLAAVRLEWNPHIDFLPPADLIQRKESRSEDILALEKVALLCMIETAQRIASIEIGPEYLQKFQSWLNCELERLAGGKDNLIPEAQAWASLSSRERLEILHIARQDAPVDEGAASAILVAIRLMERCEDIAKGTVTGLEVLLENQGLMAIYSLYQSTVDYKPYFKLAGHAKPTLRVLEVGAGTGGTTSEVLKALCSAEGARLYSKYHFTDISSGFFPNAKERFTGYTGIEYSILDISKSPIDQGFERGSYDIVVAANVLHATPNLQETLRNVRKLLKPDGRLFLQELCPIMRCFNYVMGVLPGWWLGADDGRPNEPFVTTARWDRELRAAGFSGLDAMVHDRPEPYQINANMLSTVVGPEAQLEKEIGFLYHERISVPARDVAHRFTEAGYVIKWYTLGEEIGSEKTIIALLDLDAPFLYDMSAEDLEATKNFLSNCSRHSTSIIWVTAAIQVHCKDPRYGLLPGFARTIRSETSLDFATFEVDRFGDAAWQALIKLYEHRRQSPSDEEFDAESEYAFFNEKLHTGRFHWISSVEDDATALEPGTQARLAIEKYGVLDTLSWHCSEAKTRLADNEVEVEIRSVGLNFRDVLVGMGIVDGRKDEFGLEGSGVVVRVAPGVESLRVGDRVFTMGVGCFSMKIVTSEKHCVRIPDRLTFEEAATMPCVYSTVIHSLVNVGGLEKGQSVLIHSACGGVGLGAIYVCKMLEAEIYVTVGSEEKALYLMNEFDIPRHKIFDSRSASFLPNLMRETNGKGVDLVLNSLSGELLHASWKCVAKYGKMLEIGKRDFIGRGMLSMDIFQANRSFVGIDLASLVEEKPHLCQRLFEQCLTYYEKGGIEPIRMAKVFQATQVSEAFRFMQKGQHIGKIVINMPASFGDLSLKPISSDAKFLPEVAYLLVGGLGGLGRAVATWMVERGARNLVFLSRSAGNKLEDKAFFEELNTQGCKVLAVPGSVASIEDVRRAVSLTSMRIAGVIQLSMVLRDQSFRHMDHEDWRITLSAKVEGTWNLHNTLKDTHLDFFMLFSSLSGTIGQWGQSNYAAANTFLDSFVQYRHSLGLPASVVDIGVMEDVGYVSRNAQVLDVFINRSMHTLRESDLLRAVSMAIRNSAPALQMDGSYCNLSQITTGIASTRSILDPNTRATWKRDLRTAIYRNREAEQDLNANSSNEILKEFLTSVASNPAVLDHKESSDFLVKEIGQQIKLLVLSSDEEIDPKGLFVDMGVDSLVSIEIRNWWRRVLGLQISVLELMNAGSVERLSLVAVNGLRTKYGPKQITLPGGSAMKNL